MGGLTYRSPGELRGSGWYNLPQRLSLGHLGLGRQHGSNALRGSNHSVSVLAVQTRRLTRSRALSVRKGLMTLGFRRGPGAQIWRNALLHSYLIGPERCPQKSNDPKEQNGMEEDKKYERLDARVFTYVRWCACSTKVGVLHRGNDVAVWAQRAPRGATK